MKSIRSSFLRFVACGALVVLPLAMMSAAAAKKSAGKLVTVTEKEAAWAAKAKAEYPTSLCVVSDDKLGGDMGEPVDMIYREQGKPDRLISLCCKDCIKEFNDDPDKVLKALDGAAAKKKKGAPGEPKAGEHKH